MYKTGKRLAAALIVGASGLAASGAVADVLTVCPDGSADYTRIQNAIDAAADGDIVQLCDTFFPASNAGLTDFRGKAITVRSASGDPELCTMHARFLFMTGEGPNSLLAGVTMTWGGEIGTIWIEDASPTFEDVHVVDSANLTMAVRLLRSDALFRRCVIAGNSATYSEGGAVGGLSIHSSSPRLEECAILGNDALLHAGGVRCTSGAAPSFLRCTIAGNRAGTHGGGIIVDSSSHATLENCVLWGNCAGTVGDEAVVDAGGTLTMICSDVDSTGFAGAGTFEYQGENLYVDPLFCGPITCESAPTSTGDYRLAQNSPCLAAPGCGLIGAFEQGCGVIAVEGWSWGRVKALHR